MPPRRLSTLCARIHTAAFSVLIPRRIVFAALLMLGFTVDGLAQSDPLPSWSDGAAKQAILDFVVRVTREGGPDYVWVF